MEAAKVYRNRYQDTAMRFNGFCHLFGVWKGSVIKLIWHDLLIFLIIYAGINLTYRNVFLYYEPYGQYFELICIYASK